MGAYSILKDAVAKREAARLHHARFGHLVRQAQLQHSQPANDPKPMPVAGNHGDVRTKDVRIFYATAFEVVDARGVVRPDVEYTHAVDASEALNTFWAGHGDWVGRCRIVGVAPVVGFHVEDEHGERLRA